jgi:methionyl-tRNA formyltransferase
MKTYNIAFFGTSDRSIPILEKIKEHPQLNLSLIVTKKDVKFGRKQTLKETEVKKWAMKNSVSYFLTDALGKDSEDVIEQLLSSDIHCGVVADFSFIIPEKIIKTPPFGLVNVHFSLLPRWRGASPVQAAILHGDEKTGITYHLVSKEMDRGEIISQIEYNITDDITSGELYDEMFVLAAEKLPETLLTYLENKAELKPQNESEATYTYSPTNPKSTFIYKEDARIDWGKDAGSIARMTRAFQPWPVVWTTLKELEKGTGVKFRSDKNKELKVKIFGAKNVDGELDITELQVEGGKKLSWGEFMNGYATQ